MRQRERFEGPAIFHAGEGHREACGGKTALQRDRRFDRSEEEEPVVTEHRAKARNDRALGIPREVNQGVAAKNHIALRQHR